MHFFSWKTKKIQTKMNKGFQIKAYSVPQLAKKKLKISTSSEFLFRAQGSYLEKGGSLL